MYRVPTGFNALQCMHLVIPHLIYPKFHDYHSRGGNTWSPSEIPGFPPQKFERSCCRGYVLLSWSSYGCLLVSFVCFFTGNPDPTILEDELQARLSVVGDGGTWASWELLNSKRRDGRAGPFLPPGLAWEPPIGRWLRWVRGCWVLLELPAVRLQRKQNHSTALPVSGWRCEDINTNYRGVSKQKRGGRKKWIVQIRDKWTLNYVTIGIGIGKCFRGGNKHLGVFDTAEKAAMAYDAAARKLKGSSATTNGVVRHCGFLCGVERTEMLLPSPQAFVTNFSYPFFSPTHFFFAHPAVLDNNVIPTKTRNWEHRSAVEGFLCISGRRSVTLML